jgi:hypothetical protein
MFLHLFAILKQIGDWSNVMSSRPLVALIAALAINIHSASYTMAAEPAITTYGERNPQAPDELDLFSFLVGKWSGGGRTRLQNESYVEWEGATWIGRYILNGMAIGDELHAPGPDGKTYLGITLRHFDTHNDAWIVEFLNVSQSFLRRQVNPRSGFVRQDADGIHVIAEDEAQAQFRETYRVLDQNHFTYTADRSPDGGRTWGPVLYEFRMTRIE